jgi:hypothetical protein
MIFIQTPETYTPGYNEQIFQSSGNTASKNSYKYIYNIYDSTGVTKLVPSIKIPPRPTDNSSIFDAGRIVENYLSSDIAILDTGSEGVKQNSNSYYPYVVKVGEEYDLSTTGVTSYPDLITSSGTVYAWNAALPFQEFRTFNPIDFTGSTASVRLGKALSSIDLIMAADGFKRINVDEEEWIYGMYVEVNGFKDYMVTVYYSGNSYSYVVDNPYTLLSSNDDRFVRFPSGTATLNKIPSGSITTSDPLPIIQTGALTYSIYTRNSVGATSSQLYTYQIQDSYFCRTDSKYDKYRLHFLNAYGGFDSFTFSKVSRITEDIERKQYKQIYGTTSGRWTYNTYDKG